MASKIDRLNCPVPRDFPIEYIIAQIDESNQIFTITLEAFLIKLL